MSDSSLASLRSQIDALDREGVGRQFAGALEDVSQWRIGGSAR